MHRSKNANEWIKDLTKLGCAVECDEASKQKLILEQLPSYGTNMMFELDDGRVGLVMDMQISSNLDIRTRIALRLEAPWGRLNIRFLPNPSTHNRKYEYYDFPGTVFGFDRSVVINEYLSGKVLLAPHDEIDGLLLAVIESPIPDEFPDYARIPVRVSAFYGRRDEAVSEFRVIVERGAVCRRHREREIGGLSKAMAGRDESEGAVEVTSTFA